MIKKSTKRILATLLALTLTAGSVWNVCAAEGETELPAQNQVGGQ